MKKFASLLLALVLICTAMTTFAPPAFAADEPTVVTPINNSIDLYDSNEYIIKEDCVINEITLYFCTLTIADGVHVTVESGCFLNYGGTLNIECGAILTIKELANGFTNCGIINVYGALDFTSNSFSNVTNSELNVYGNVTVAANNFSNDGTINAHGIIDISECDQNEITNYENGVINRYSDATLLGFDNFKNNGTINDLECSEDHSCVHSFNKDNICTKCHVKGCKIGVHMWENGTCTACNTSCTHKWDASTGKCAVCFTPCTHTWNANNGKCDICNTACNHNWDYTTDKCTVCQYICKHMWNSATGKCSVCEKTCNHEGLICSTCYKVIVTDTGHTGSTLSEGSLTVIVGVACLAVGFLAAMFIFKKKKPAVADGAENTDEE